MVMDRTFLLQAIIQSFQPIGSVFDLGVQISRVKAAITYWPVKANTGDLNTIVNVALSTIEKQF